MGVHRVYMHNLHIAYALHTHYTCIHEYVCVYVYIHLGSTGHARIILDEGYARKYSWVIAGRISAIILVEQNVVAVMIGCSSWIIKLLADSGFLPFGASRLLPFPLLTINLGSGCFSWASKIGCFQSNRFRFDTSILYDNQAMGKRTRRFPRQYPKQRPKSSIRLNHDSSFFTCTVHRLNQP